MSDIHILQTSAVYGVTLISLLTTWNEVEGGRGQQDREQNRINSHEM